MDNPSRRAIGDALLATRVVPILRGKKTGDHVPAVIDTLVASGIRCLEITTNTPGAFGAVAAARQRHGAGVELGVGTVLTADQVAAAAAAGATFVVSPHTDPAVGAAAAEHGLAWYPGALTPTEVLAAWGYGATAVKLFPASLGGPKYLRELLGPIDGVPILPTGGVTLVSVPDYLAAGAVAVGMGGPLLGDALDGGDLRELAARAVAVLNVIAEATA
jgi:2-dehydro-3-deoxyphosphogluconate aldolase / (4S)-4-hydroxy-2-oxoglutarate aldolase